MENEEANSNRTSTYGVFFYLKALATGHRNRVHILLSYMYSSVFLISTVSLEADMRSYRSSKQDPITRI